MDFTSTSRSTNKRIIPGVLKVSALDQQWNKNFLFGSLRFSVFKKALTVLYFETKTVEIRLKLIDIYHFKLSP